MSESTPTLRIRILVCVVLAVVTALVFWNITGNDFIRFDDDQYITDNPPVQAGLTSESFAWAFYAYHSNNWHPLTWLAHMTDQTIFGSHPSGHHLTSLLLHALNAVLLLLVLNRITRSFWPSVLVAALFALHPTHVESVAWASEKKDLLSTLFAILTIAAYARYTRQRDGSRYALVVGMFVLGLLAKPMLVTLPFVLLLLDYWPLNRSLPLPTLIREKIPLLVLTAASSWITLQAQSAGGVVKTLESFSLGARLSNVVVAYVSYLGKLVWPVDLAILYPHPHAFPAWKIAAAALLLVGLSGVALSARHKHAAVLVGWLWFLGTLVPVIGLVQVGNQAYADRYTYIPFIGLFIAISFFAFARLDRRIVGAVSLIVLSVLGLLSWRQTFHWRTTITLFAHTIEVTENNYLIHDNLGNLLAEGGDLDGAMEQYAEAIRIRPEFTQGQYNMGVALTKAKRIDEAIPYFEEAILQQPDFVRAHFNLAICHAQRNRAEPAIHHLREVIRIDPENAAAHRNLGGILFAMGRKAEAEPHFAEAERLSGSRP